MPWTKADVEEHKKGLTDAEKEKWVKIANAALASCLADGGEQGDCEGRAIRIANAKCQTNMVYVQNRTGTVRSESIGGVDYLVAPVVSIVAGVMNEELLLPEEYGAFPGMWDGRPVVLDHPFDSDGLPISANDPNVLDACAVGRIYNTTSNGKLRHEMWIDVAQAQRSADGQELLRRMKGNTPVEVSTAYFRDLDDTAGEKDGKAYVGIARHIRPDHLAVLLEGEGACNWQDGCGAPRVNQEPNPDVQSPTESNESAIVKALKTIGQEIHEFITHERRNRMDEKVQRILEASAGFTQEGLEAMTECALDAIIQLLPAEEPQTNEEDETPPEEETPDVKDIIKAVLDELGVTAALEKLQANENEERDSLIGRIAAHEQNRLTKEHLAKMDLDSLRALELSYRPRSYAGQGGEPQTNDTEFEEYPVPEVFKKEVSGG